MPLRRHHGPGPSATVEAALGPSGPAANGPDLASWNVYPLQQADAAPTAAGLTAEAAARALRRDGPNEVPPPRPPRVAARIARQLLDPLVALLLASAVVTAALRDVTDTAVILLVVAVNTAIGVAQEVRADQAIAALHRLAAPTARVVRDRTEQLVPASELVRRDVVRVAAGDVVPADLILDSAYRLQVDESALTGESVPVARCAGEELSAGTVAVTGRARGTVLRTGPDSALGRIAALVSRSRPIPTLLQRRLARLGRVLGVVAVSVSALVTLLGVVAGRPVVQMAVTGVSLVVAAVPESLPAVVTLALALGAKRMARAHAIARRLQAVETLGSVTVLLSDKTGTLTEGRMAVQAVVTVDGNAYPVRGRGYEPTGSVIDADGTLDRRALLDLARAVALCSDARLSPPDPDHPQWTAVGDPMEAALVAFAARAGLDVQAERAAAPRLSEEPFDAATRRMTTVNADPDVGRLIVCKGAPEAVLTRTVLPGDARGLDTLRTAADSLAASGLRVLAVACGPPDRLRPLGLLGIGDPIRAEAPDLVRACAAAGVRIVMVTGDHPITAATIGRQLGICRDGDAVVRGDQPGFAAADLDQVRVFARTRPEQKLDLVTALQERGHIVAMTGDGVNDAPALRRADIGVAMGGGGTQVARQAADLVLTGDDLATVVTAVGEGRRVYDNIRRFLRYALSGGVAELLVMLAGPLVGLPLPLLPAQILWINLLTHGLPGVALGSEPGAPTALTRPPRSPQESVLGAGLGRAVLVNGSLIAACTLGAGVWTGYRGGPWQSMTFLVLGLAQLGLALAVRAPRGRGRPGNPWLGAALLSSAVLLFGAVALAPLRDLLGTASLPVGQVALAAVIAAVPGLTVALARAIRAGKGADAGTGTDECPGIDRG
jgi:P-type Ca2+ transporter type 2C